MGKLRKTVSVILLVDDENVLLQLRDDRKEIPYPGCWVTFGGTIEPGESPLAAAIRELDEELGLTVLEEEVFFYKSHVAEDFEESVFWMRLREDPEKLELKEGQGMRVFHYKEALRLKLGFADKEILRQFFEWDRPHEVSCNKDDEE